MLVCRVAQQNSRAMAVHMLLAQAQRPADSQCRACIIDFRAAQDACRPAGGSPACGSCLLSVCHMRRRSLSGLYLPPEPFMPKSSGAWKPLSWSDPRRSRRLPSLHGSPANLHQKSAQNSSKLPIYPRRACHVCRSPSLNPNPAKQHVCSLSYCVAI